jgi:formylglycine-generating enzyme required for sulfatase activity
MSDPTDSPAGPAVQQLPRRLDGYLLLREVGRGGMGIVYEAEHQALGRVVALKVLVNTGGDKAAIERFRREARSAARLHHTNIVPIFEVGQCGETLYYAMQFIAGEGLDQVVARMRLLRAGVPAADVPLRPVPHAPRTPITPDHSSASSPTEFWAPEDDSPATGDAPSATTSPASCPAEPPLPVVAADYFRAIARIGQQAASALAYAHARGIIHRDIKPSNLMLEGSVVWVTDFGLARAEEDSLTAPGEIVGTLRYMAPERFAGACDARADVYSLGLTLYELLVLRAAFGTRDKVQLINEVQTREPPRPRTLDPRIPRDLETIVLRAIDKNPHRRYQSADALAEDLRRFLADEPIRARRVSNAERLLRWCRRHPLEATLAGVILTLLVAIAIGSSIGAVWMRRQRDEVLDERRRADAAERSHREALIRDVLTTSPENVPAILNTLRPAHDLAVTSLRQALEEQGTPPRTRLRAAVALTLLGQPQPERLIAAVSDAPAAEARHLLAALGEVRELVIEPLHRLAGQEKRVAVRTRLAATLVYLGDLRLAQSVLAPGPDPTPRTAFIEDFPSWRGDLSGLPALLRSHTDPNLRSGLCAAVGRFDPEELSAEERRALEEVLRELWTEAPDGGTHSAAGWALRQWKITPPTPPRSRQPAAGKHWFVNSLGMTMIELPAGAFTPLDGAQPPSRTILSRPFFLCDQETSLALFKQFARERSLPFLGEPGGWTELPPFKGQTDDCPVGNPSWQDAVRFCNWLSKKEGLPPFYRGEQINKDAIRSDQAGPGYRLPTSAEWEYAYRGGAATLFPTGEEANLLMRYGNIELMRTLPCGSRQPNSWGLFDVIGNVWEICDDINGGQRPGLNIDPILLGDDVKQVVMRGGAMGSGSYYSRTFMRIPTPRDYRNPDGSTGFRVACSFEPTEAAADGALDEAERYANSLKGLPNRGQEVDAWWECTRFALHHKRWQRGLTGYRKLQAALPDVHIFWCQTAPLYLQAGDEEGYRRYCHDMLQRFGKSADPKIMERTAKVCLLAPLPAEDLDLAAGLAERAAKAEAKHPAPMYAQLALALAEYRRGKLTEAQQQANNALLSRIQEWNLVVPAHLIRAMVKQRRGDADGARVALGLAVAAWDRLAHEPVNPNDLWHDWFLCQVLRREAEGLISPR